jgi:signal transduction histidine kinase
LDQFYRSVLAALIANLRDGVMAEDESGRIIVSNQAFSRMFRAPLPEQLAGASAQELRESLWHDLVADVDGWRLLTEQIRGARTLQLEVEMLLKDGRVIDRDYVPVPAPDGTVVHMWHYRDVTARRQLERRLRESSRRLRALSAFTEQAREEERRHLARTLHDELGQLFSSIRLELGAAIAQFRDSRLEGLRPVVDRLQAAAGLSDLAVAYLRRVTTALRPPVLDHLGLVAAIRWEASLFSKRTGIRCHVRAPATIELDDAQVTALYRIFLAALDNIARHAAAGAARVNLTRQRGATILEVRDNGRGITEDEVHNPSTMGLLAMRERALAIGGDLRVSGTRGRGTRIVVTVPDTSRAARVRAPRAGTRTKAHA